MTKTEVSRELQEMFPDGVIEYRKGKWHIKITHAGLEVRITGHWIPEHGFRVLQMKADGLDHILPPDTLAGLSVKVTQGDGVKVSGSGKSTHVTSLF